MEFHEKEPFSQCSRQGEESLTQGHLSERTEKHKRKSTNGENCWKLMENSKIDKDLYYVFKNFKLIYSMQRNQGHGGSVVHAFSSSLNKANNAIT